MSMIALLISPTQSQQGWTENVGDGKRIEKTSHINMFAPSVPPWLEKHSRNHLHLHLAM